MISPQPHLLEYNKIMFLSGAPGYAPILLIFIGTGYRFSMSDIRDAYARLLAEISRCEADYGRTPGAVTLLAVSKTRTSEEIRIIRDLGQRHFAENYLQEAVEKINALGDPELIWHFIGPVQSNKTRLIAERFQWVHSLDRIKTARRLHDARPAHLPPLNACVQINISAEPTKGGIAPEELPGFIRACEGLDRLRLRGLMALPEPAPDFERQRAPFRALHQLLEEVRHLRTDLDTLSMGTTLDLRAAIAEGATMVRIGTALFGPRL